MYFISRLMDVVKVGLKGKAIAVNTWFKNKGNLK